MKTKLRETIVAAEAGNWRLRFWFKQMEQAPEALGGEKLFPFDAELAVARFTSNHRLELQRCCEALDVEQLILENFDGDPVAAFEITNRRGLGIVSYIEWP